MGVDVDVQPDETSHFGLRIEAACENAVVKAVHGGMELSPHAVLCRMEDQIQVSLATRHFELERLQAEAPTVEGECEVALAEAIRTGGDLVDRYR